MIEKNETEILSRRRAFSILGLAALSLAVLPTLLMTSDAEAQTGTTTTTTQTPQSGTQRRQERRTARTERRQERRAARTERRAERQAGRTERRQTRQGKTTTTSSSPQ
jgi:hypothetical protein